LNDFTDIIGRHFKQPKEGSASTAVVGAHVRTMLGRHGSFKFLRDERSRIAKPRRIQMM